MACSLRFGLRIEEASLTADRQRNVDAEASNDLIACCNSEVHLRPTSDEGTALVPRPRRQLRQSDGMANTSKDNDALTKGPETPAYGPVRPKNVGTPFSRFARAPLSPSSSCRPREVHFDRGGADHLLPPEGERHPRGPHSPSACHMVGCPMARRTPTTPTPQTAREAQSPRHRGQCWNASEEMCTKNFGSLLRREMGHHQFLTHIHK